MSFVRHYLIALQFFTRIPLGAGLAQWVGFSPEMLRASAAHFPGVGWLVGAVAAASFVAARLLLPDVPGAEWLAAVASTGATLLLTGALHEDGLADVADGLGGARDAARALEIMKDSHIGVFGVLALLLALLLKIGLLIMLDSLDASLELVAAALFGAHVVSRYAPLWLIRLLPHVGDSTRSKSRPMAGQITPARLALALLWTVAALALLQWRLPDVAWWAGLLAALLAWLRMWRWFARRLQGFTGDCLGATQQVCELAFYLGLVLAAS